MKNLNRSAFSTKTINLYYNINRWLVNNIDRGDFSLFYHEIMFSHSFLGHSASQTINVKIFK